MVLFGRNTASFKFALAKSILELAGAGRETVSLEELAVPYAGHVAEHLRRAPKQGSSPPGKFLAACRGFNEGTIDSEALRDQTVQVGFNNVIDAFHTVGAGAVPTRFFLDERKNSFSHTSFSADD